VTFISYMSNTQPQEANAPGQNKTVTIVVNGRQETVAKGKLTYEEVVALAYPNPDFQNNTYKVTYFRRTDSHEGTLTKGGKPVEVTDGMVFTVVQSVRS
jgi:hypothetical protein